MRKQGFLHLAVLSVLLLSVSCRTGHYRVVSVDASRLEVGNRLDGRPDGGVEAMLQSYRQGMDSVMSTVIGFSQAELIRKRPEGALGNLVADVLREAAAEVLGHEADVALMNTGGMRNDLPKGQITVGTVYQILPFQNSLTVLTLKGTDLVRVFEDVARRHGEALSGARIEISQDGRLLSCSVHGQPVQPDSVYSLSTIDYLAQGNDGMGALKSALTMVSPQDGVLRDVFMRYVRKKTALNQAITGRIEGRVTVR